MIQLDQAAAGKIVTLTLKGRLSKDDYELFMPKLEGLMRSTEKDRLLVELRDFQVWRDGSFVKDFRLFS